MIMTHFINSSIGKKVIMSLSGLFLIVFLLVHLGINLLLFVSEEVFNEVAHFMAVNPIMFVMQHVLALGFIIHIIYALVTSYLNMKARPVGYAVIDRSKSSSWESRNMLITGALVFSFLVLHLINYFFKMKFGEAEIASDYVLVTDLFKEWYFTLIYIISFVLLYLHLNHAFQSAFQTLGLNNSKWLKRWKIIGTIYALIICLGFISIAACFFARSIV
ncbi:MAG: hypothetical protein A2033_06600 [Bacteroidetes bacterium GWA2_31_9]|nr:MAG: hypothetical protein A2033_06600 [Bacteroidetes bacterium GWA2_31_9]